jgi:Flp pilus assembly protein TadD
MGRSRRRNRHDAPHDFQRHGFDRVVAGPETATETLSPTFVSVPSYSWTAESDFPILALDGLNPRDEIHGPDLNLGDLAAADLLMRDSDDPSQLVLATDPDPDEDLYPGAEAWAADSLDTQRPILVLEAQPYEEERRAVPREIDTDLVAVPSADQIEMPLPDAEDPGISTEADSTAIIDAEIPAAELLPVEALPEPPIAGEFNAAAVAALEPVVDPLELRCDEARAAATEGRLLDARIIYREVIAERPSHLASRNNLALLFERLGDNQGALSEYDHALDVDGGHATLLANRGALLGAMGRYAAAERDLKKVLRVEPGHMEALFNLGVVMTRKGLWSEAVPLLRRVVEIDPTRGPAYFYLGEALNKVDDLYGAMAAYQRAAELMPDHPRALYGLGIVYDRLGRPDDAARMYRRSRETGKR